MSIQTLSKARPPALAAPFEKDLSKILRSLRADVDRRPHTSASLAAVERMTDRLRATLGRVSRRRGGDLADRLEELDYPVAALHAYFARSKAALPKRATEIMAEYVRDRLLEVRVVAKANDLRR